ncbi:MAG: GNAT family N-acetyltransferase [Aquisalimonadaceae bacterium]
MFSLEVEQGLALRLLQTDNAEELFALVDRNRDHLREWLSWLDLINSVSDSRRFIERALQHYADRRALHAGIHRQDALAGVIAFNHIDRNRGQARIGYWLAAACQGQGLATRACRAMTEHAIAGMGMGRVEIACAESNGKSRSIPERLGYRETGYVHRAEWLYDHYVHHVVYSMSADDWQRRCRQFGASPGEPSP